jgi:nitronate monooxygenase
MATHQALARANVFCETFDMRAPILMTPMVGAYPVSLAVAIANAGGLGGCGALMTEPNAIRSWTPDVRAGTNGGLSVDSGSAS